MFLTRGVVYHEPTWDAWFRSAAGLLPTAALHAADCAEGVDSGPQGWGQATHEAASIACLVA